MIYYFIVVFAVLIASIAQILLKKASQIKYENIFKQYLNFRVILGYSIMMISMLITIFAMNNGVLLKEVSIIDSLGYIFVHLLSFFVFQEKISNRKIVAIILIMLGIFVFFS